MRSGNVQHWKKSARGNFFWEMTALRGYGCFVQQGRSSTDIDTPSDIVVKTAWFSGYQESIKPPYFYRHNLFAFSFCAWFRLCGISITHRLWLESSPFPHADIFLASEMGEGAASYTSLVKMKSFGPCNCWWMLMPVSWSSGTRRLLQWLCILQYRSCRVV